MTYDIVWLDGERETRAPYATEHEAVTQAIHDMALGKDVDRIQGSEDGTVIWSNNQLRNKLSSG